MAERRDYDLVVIGAGPAGSTVSTLVKKYNPKAHVLVIEKALFPRHHIGESLLPGLIPVLKEMGVFEKINAGGFPRKIGVVFVWGRDRKPWDADFNNLNLEMVKKYGRALDTEFSWQVLRSRYDEILLEHAKSVGVEAWLGWRAVSPVERGGRVRGVVVEDAAGRRRTLRCRMLADCSGQKGFLSKVRRTRVYDEALKNVAAYAYFKGAKWKFEYAGHPDKTKIFVCSTPEGWFWYIPLSKDTVSVGLVSKADFVRRDKTQDFRERFFKALKACPEIWPLLKDAELMRGVDPADPERDFFTAGDWSFESASACGNGWLAAGDAAFFIDPLLSSGVMMAHLSGHRAAYAINTAWRQSDPALLRALWSDYDRFCKEVGGSFLALVRYWYHHDPHAQRWWSQAKGALGKSAPLDLSDKMSFVAVAAGVTYHFERAYTSQSLLFGSSGAEHSWQWEGTKLELQRWTRQILAIVETGFLKGPGRQAKVRRAQKMVGLQKIPNALVPRWTMLRKRSLTFLPSSRDGVLRPISRLDLRRARGSAPTAADPRRVLPSSYMRILDLIDGRRSVAIIKEALYGASTLPLDIIDGQVFRLLKDLAVLGALSLDPGPSGSMARPSAASAAWRSFRTGERALKAGDCPAAEKALSNAIASGLECPWIYALRGEARRHLGRLAEGAADLDRAVRLNEDGSGRASGSKVALRALVDEFDASVARGWVGDRIRILRAKMRLQTGDLAAARSDAEAALAVNPRQSEALVVRAKAAAGLGDLAGAREDLKAALTIETGRKGDA
ncbi:MAG: tryptophan 7-halogenase [Elusimicrobia bacterium]|nr:tryptophan 7-halogenase [Elusimicrobiota bacterium]